MTESIRDDLIVEGLTVGNYFLAHSQYISFYSKDIKKAKIVIRQRFKDHHSISL